MKLAFNHYHTLFFFISLTIPINGCNKTPKLSIVIVIDQFSVDYLDKLKPFLHGGLKFLMQHGVNYRNAFYDHCKPGTAAGHTVLSTGTVGYNHGIINNQWYNEQGKLINSDDDNAKRAAVFSPAGLYSFGKSANNTMVDSISDQAIMHSYMTAPNHVWAFSLKSRAATAMAGRLGKAIWFDLKSGNFTSSKAYFEELPSWIKQFNQDLDLDFNKKLTWPLFYPEDDEAYNFPASNNYTHAQHKTLIGKPQSFTKTDKGNFELFGKMPYSSTALVDLVKIYLDKHVTPNEEGKHLIWLSLSGLDMLVHEYGPYSKEAIDLVYHMDKNIQDLIDYAYKKVDPQDVLLTLTADHGGHPIVELLHEEGFSLALRINANTLKDKVNTIIENSYGISGIIRQFNEPHYYLDKSKLCNLSPEKKTAIINDIKKIMLQQKGIRRVWTSEELAAERFDKYDLDVYLQRQLYPGRSGDIIYSVHPYVHMNVYANGTGHLTPYAYDTQVPLIIYQNNRFAQKTIANNVWMPQFAPTLAHILQIPRPSASNSNVLPGLHF